MRASAAIFTGLLLLGCGSRTLSPSGELGVTGDRSGNEARPAPDGAASCVGLEAFAGGKTISPRRALDALFLPDRRGLVLASVTTGSEEAELSLERFAGGRELLATIPSLRSIEWLVPGSELLIIEPLSKMQPYTLSQLSLESRATSIVAKEVCDHRSGPGGSLAVVESCDPSWDGLLRARLDGAKSLVGVAKGIEAASFEISPDGKRVAFISDVKHGSGGECGAGLGMLREWSAAEGDRIVAKEVVSRSLQYLADGALLWQSRPGCGTPTAEALVLGRPGQPPKTIANGPVFGYALDGPLYQLSPDGRALIGAKEISAGGPLALVAVPLDGGPIKTLADDLFSFYMTAMAFQPWRFTPTGGHLVYTTVAGYPQMGLAALSTKDWSRSALTTALFGPTWGESPEGDAVGFVEGTHESGTNTLRLASLPSTGASVELASFKGTIQVPRPSFLPARRGVLYQQRPSATLVELRLVPREGGASTLLGSWSQSQLRTVSLEGSYRVDPSGCLVLFDTETGTRLRSLSR